MRHVLGAALIAAASAVALAAPAEAGLIGKSLDAVYYYPTATTAYPQASFTPANFTVGAGQETDGSIEGVTHILVDFADASLTVTLTTVLASPTWGTAPFNGVIFTSAAALGITSATVDPGTTMSGFDDSRVSFDANRIGINWNGLSYVDGTVVKLDFGVAAVPEPTSLALFSVGLVGLAALAGPAGLRRRAACSRTAC